LTSEKPPLINPENVVAAIFLVLALVFPILFHAVSLGSTFLPMFFPVALCGLLISPVPAALVGFLAPWLSALLTGMPPLYPPLAPIMSVEGLVLGGGVSLLHTRLNWTLYPSLIAGIVFQRIILVIAVFAVAPLFHLPSTVFSAGMVISGIPGIILQLVVIPPLANRLEPRMQRLREIE